MPVNDEFIEKSLHQHRAYKIHAKLLEGNWTLKTQENTEQETTICPLMSIGKTEPVVCQRTKCQWWDGGEERGECIIPELISAVFDISLAITEGQA